MTTRPARVAGLDAAARTALALIVVFALARLALAATLGLGVDEAYTIVVSRRLDLSYFDHPPLHQWIAHFAALAFGEGARDAAAFHRAVRGDGLADVRADAPAVRRARRPHRARSRSTSRPSSSPPPAAGSCPTGRCCSRSPARRSRSPAVFRRAGSARRLGPVARGGLVARPRRPVEIQRRAVRRRARRLCRAEPAPAPLVRAIPRPISRRCSPWRWSRRCWSGTGGTAGSRSRFRASAARWRARWRPAQVAAMALGEIALPVALDLRSADRRARRAARAGRSTTKSACFSSVSRCRRSFSSR